MNTHLKFLLSGAAVSCLLLPAPVMAQSTDDGVNSYDEITVTARKREESLTEVPVSISVLNDDLIEDTGILTQQDLFDLVPGIQYDQPLDRNSASPSVRGVQSNEIATNRTKITQFIDGMPVLGSQGNIQFGSVQQVEVFRGPQSAAFGRSTFGGAINYVTKDPSDEFEAEATAEINDYGTRRIGVAVGGPVTDTLGYRLDYQWEDSTAPDEFIATDGTQYGERSSDAWSGKLVWSPTDNLNAEFMYAHVESADSPSVQYFIGEEARNGCWDGTLITNMGTGVYAIGQPNCDWSQGTQIRAQGPNRAATVSAALAAGTFGGFGVLDETDTTGVRDDLLFLADSEGIRESGVGSFDEKDRFQGQIDYSFDNGSLLQFSAFYGEEEYIRRTDAADEILPITIGTAMTNTMYRDTSGSLFSNDGTPYTEADALTDASLVAESAPYVVSIVGPTATVGGVMADPSEIEETYAEIRYVSPSADRLRYVVGASYYDYSFITSLYFNGYESILNGTTDRYFELTGDDVTVADQLFIETAENFGVYGNVSYDITDRLTTTLEARYQIDTVGGEDPVSGDGDTLETTAFLPRLSFNYALDDSTSFYGQYARGNNPAGVNVGFYDPDNVAQLECLDVNGDPLSDADRLVVANSRNGSSLCGQNYVNFTAEDFQTYEEETIDNFEVGMKGSAFDNRLQFATAIFYMDWQNQGFSANLNWDDNTNAMAMNDYTSNRTFINEGDIKAKGIEFEGTFELTDDVSIRAQGSYLDSEYDNYCNVALVNNGLAETSSGLIVGPTALPQGDLYRPSADSGTGYGCIDLAGKTVVNQSAFTGSISPSYRTRLSNGLRFDARADIRYEGPKFIDTLNLFETNAVSTTNVSAGLTGDRWGLTLYVNNLFDDNTPLRYGNGDDYSIVAPFSSAAEESNYQVTPRTQRSIGLRARLNY